MQERTRAVSRIQFENERARVREWRFPPGSETGPHRHENDFVVVPLTGGQLVLESKDGEKRVDLQAGQSYFRERGIEHNAVNQSERDVVLLEIELKGE